MVEIGGLGRKYLMWPGLLLYILGISSNDD